MPTMQRVRIKICGITRPEDGVAAAEAGADAIGLVFYSPSPRAVSVEAAGAIIRELPPFITKVGLFVDASESEITSVLNTVPLDTLQFHGGEKPVDCSRYFRPYIKAVKMQNGTDLCDQARQYAGAAGLLLDTYVEGIAGGTGRVFDWEIIPRDLSKPVILAGGLTAENVAEAIHKVRPYAVDVSGGVESDKGIKDPKKIQAFINKVAECNHEYTRAID